jgi:hypothetical protein
VTLAIVMPERSEFDGDFPDMVPPIRHSTIPRCLPLPGAPPSGT